MYTPCPATQIDIFQLKEIQKFLNFTCVFNGHIVLMVDFLDALEIFLFKNTFSFKPVVIPFAKHLPFICLLPHLDYLISLFRYLEEVNKNMVTLLHVYYQNVLLS